MTGGSRRCIVVSTLAEACFYADHGYDDILYAYPLPFDKVAFSYPMKWYDTPFTAHPTVCVCVCV